MVGIVNGIALVGQKDEVLIANKDKDIAIARVRQYFEMAKVLVDEYCKALYGGEKQQSQIHIAELIQREVQYLELNGSELDLGEIEG